MSTWGTADFFWWLEILQKQYLAYNHVFSCYKRSEWRKIRRYVELKNAVTDGMLISKNNVIETLFNYTKRKCVVLAKKRYFSITTHFPLKISDSIYLKSTKMWNKSHFEIRPKYKKKIKRKITSRPTPIHVI